MDVTGNSWEHRQPTGLKQAWSERATAATPIQGRPRYRSSSTTRNAWIFKGTGLHDGSSLPNVIDSDIDHLDPSSPSNIQVLGHSPLALSSVYTNQGEWGGYTYSDMTYYTEESGAGIFDSGTVNWIYALSPCTGPRGSCPSTAIQQITGNLLWLFGQGPAGN